MMMTRPATTLLAGLRARSKLGLTVNLRKNSAQTAQLSSSMTTETTTSDRKNGTKWSLFASVCIERLPIITCDVNDLEKRYSSLINELNVRKSLLSDHELRHLKDLEIAEKRKQSQESQQGGEGEVVIETALDYEDQCMKQLQAFTFAERKTGGEAGSAGQTAVKKPAGVLKNLDKVLDKKLVLIVYNQAKSQWQLPEMEWSQSDESLRSTAERSVHTLHADEQELAGSLKVDFLGNAPAGVYKTKPLAGNGQKHYIFKAQYKSGGELLAKTKVDYAWIRKEELPDFIKDAEYLECLNNLILDF